MMFEFDDIKFRGVILEVGPQRIRLCDGVARSPSSYFLGADDHCVPTTSAEPFGHFQVYLGGAESLVKNGWATKKYSPHHARSRAGPLHKSPTSRVDQDLATKPNPVVLSIKGACQNQIVP